MTAKNKLYHHCISFTDYSIDDDRNTAFVFISPDATLDGLVERIKQACKEWKTDPEYREQLLTTVYDAYGEEYDDDDDLSDVELTLDVVYNDLPEKLCKKFNLNRNLKSVVYNKLDSFKKF